MGMRPKDLQLAGVVVYVAIGGLAVSDVVLVARWSLYLYGDGGTRAAAQALASSGNPWPWQRECSQVSSDKLPAAGRAGRMYAYLTGAIINEIQGSSGFRAAA
jgi:hypothetical protein